MYCLKVSKFNLTILTKYEVCQKEVGALVEKVPRFKYMCDRALLKIVVEEPRGMGEVNAVSEWLLCSNYAQFGRC